MMKGKMHGKMMESAKMHYEQLMSVLDKMGMSMDEFMEAQEPEMEMEESEESEESGPDMGKVSMIVAKLKGKKSPEAEEEYEE